MFHLMIGLGVILLAVAGGLYIPRAMDRREKQKFERFIPDLLILIRRLGVDIEVDDIRFQLKGKRSVDYTVSVYQGNDVVMLKTSEKSLQRTISEKFPKYTVRIFTDFKKNRRR